MYQVLHPPQKFERSTFGMVAAMALKMMASEVTFDGMTSILNFIKIYKLA
jgi:hypothetical protein